MKQPFTWVFTLFLLGIGACPPAWGDTLTLTNGQTLEGIIVQETPTHVRLQVALQGYVDIERQTVTGLARSDAADHGRLQAQWREEFRHGQTQADAARRFEAAQQAKGLVLYQGQWITPEVFATLQQQEHVRLAVQQELTEKVRQLAVQVQQLQQENAQLRDQLAFNREVVFVSPPATAFHRDGQ